MATAGYALAVGSYLALIALLTGWITWLAPPPRPLITPVLLILGAPLLLALRGLLRRNRYTLAWSTLLVPIYFVHGVVYAAGAGREQWLGAAEVILTLIYFIAILVYLRLSRGASPTASPG